jgi:hemerythrin-like metal-binding protein
MERLVLPDDLLTSIDAVDEQHRELFAWGNALLFPEDGELSALDLLNGLRYLAAYVDFHFATEECAQEQAGWERAQAHHWQHRHFRREINLLLERAETDGPSHALSLQLHYLLHDWFVGHIRFADTPFAAWLRERNALSDLQPVTREAMRQLGLDPEAVRVVGAGTFRV